MPLIDTPLTWFQAGDRGLPYWRLRIQNWGNVGTTADPDRGSILYPPVAIVGGEPLTKPPNATALVAIGSFSSVDSVIVNSLKPVPINVSPNGIQQIASVGQPVIVAPGPVYIQSHTQLYGDFYFADGDPVQRAWGPNITGSRFIEPILELLFYFSMPTNVPTSRGPFKQVRSQALGATADTIVGAYPISGRRRTSLFVRVTDTAIATVRVGLVLTDVEDTIGTGTANAVTGATLSFVTTQPASFLTVYYTLTAGAGGIFTEVISED